MIINRSINLDGFPAVSFDFFFLSLRNHVLIQPEFAKKDAQLMKSLGLIDQFKSGTLG